MPPISMTLARHSKQALQQNTHTVVDILLHHGVTGLMRYGNRQLFLEATNIVPQPVCLPSLAQELLDAELTRIFETRVHPSNYAPDNSTIGDTKWKYWVFTERVGQVLMAKRRYYPTPPPIPMLLFVRYPQMILDEYHNKVATLLDTYDTRQRRILMDDLLAFILPASVGYLRQMEIVYLYTKLVAWQIHG